MEETIRLNKFLSDAGVCSRREADRLIEAGRVLVDGKPAGTGTKIRAGQKIFCDGKPVSGREAPVFLVVNKPKGIVCTTSEKEYAVAVNKPVTEEFLQKMRDGVWLEELEVSTKPCQAWQTGPHTFHIVLTQGLNRQVRRMCRALGYHVMNLKRVRLMHIRLGNLKRGEYRTLTDEELTELLQLVKNSTNRPMQEMLKEQAKWKKT